MTITRRRFVGGLAASAALGLLDPTAVLAAGPAPAGLPSQDELWRWNQQLARYGTRYTGSPGQAAFIDWLIGQFRAVPGFELHIDRKTFSRWLAKDWSLQLDVPATAGRSGAVPVTYFYPYSGQTPRGGVTGPLVDLGTYPPAAPASSGTGYGAAFWEPARGGIALVRAAPSTFSIDSGQTAIGGYEPGKTSQQAALDYERWGALVTHPAWQGIFAPIPLLDARNAGVKAVICAWTGMPDDEVANQYNPFITPYASASGLPAPGDPGCPALWVGDSTGTQLSQAARSGQAKVTLTLTADVTAGAATETIWGWLRGSGGSGEATIVNTHTDGPNVPEENGALGLLGLARWLSGQQRNRDHCFVMVTGHFQLPQFTTTVPNARPEVGNDAISVWMRDHPDIVQRSVAGVTVEHLGCREWTTDPSGRYGPTGAFDWGATYTCQRRGSLSPSNQEEAVYLDAVRSVNQEGLPNYPVAAIEPGAVPIYLGEGAPLYAAGLGTISLIPAPTYLLQAGSVEDPARLELDRLDPRLAYAQVITFARTLAALDRTPSSEL